MNLDKNGANPDDSEFEQNRHGLARINTGDYHEK